MSLKTINEGFKSRFIGVLNESIEPSQIDELRVALDDAAFELSMRQVTNLKAYEIAFQEAIEKLYPDNAWWEITDCNIFMDLFEHRDIDHTINEIINQLKIDTSVDEAVKEESLSGNSNEPLSKEDNLAEDLDTLTESITDDESLIEALQKCLNRLNEAEISDEDQRDSDLIRSMIAKLEKRSNARFTPEEQAVLDKYNIARDNDFRQLRVANRPLNPDYDGRISKSYSGTSWTPTYHRDGDPSKINYADRARKLPQRVDSQVSARGTPNGQINSHSRPLYGQTLQGVERAAQEDRDTAPVRNMQYELDKRNDYTHRINNAQSVYDKTVAKARKTYDDEVKWATDTYRRDTVDASRYRDMAQARIDAMLGRGKKDNT